MVNNMLKVGSLHEYNIAEHTKLVDQLASLFTDYSPTDSYHNSVFVTYVVPLYEAHQFVKTLYEIQLKSEDFPRFLDVEEMFRICEILPKLCTVTVFLPHFENKCLEPAQNILLKSAAFSLTSQLSPAVYGWGKGSIIREEAGNISRGILNYIVSKILNK
jgi:hypothetical protein